MKDALKYDELNNNLTLLLVNDNYCDGDIHKFLKMLNTKTIISDEKELKFNLSIVTTKLNAIRWVLQTKKLQENEKDLILLGEELIKIGNEMIELGGE